MEKSNYDLPKILVIDDVYGWSAEDRKKFCINRDVVNITDDSKQLRKTRPYESEKPIAEIVFFSGQKKQNGKVENDLEGTIKKIEAGWKRPPRWAMIMLDLQFNTGKFDNNGIPTPTKKDRETFFGIKILERIWVNEVLRDIPVIILTQLTRNEIEDKVQEEFSKFNVVWEVVSKNDLDRDKVIDLMMDNGLLEGRQILELLKIMKTSNSDKLKEKDEDKNGIHRDVLKYTLQERLLNKLDTTNLTDEDIKKDLRQILDGVEKENRAYRLKKGPLIIGHSLPLLKAIREARKVARNTDVDVMLLGETGVGKELFAGLIHRCSKRSHKPFKAINCAAIPGHLFEAEIFGYMPGSFTGAGSVVKKGLLETVEDGIFFLDEVGELSLKHQAKLLRVIQNREFFRIGGAHPIPLRARLIYATNKDLKEEVKRNKFREDLNFRINFPPIIIPPLRERKEEDIKLLADHFIKIYEKKFNKKYLNLYMHSDAEKKLFDHAWKGNVRELEYVVMKVMYRKSIRVISEKDIDLPDSSLPGIPFNQAFKTIKNCDFENITFSDLHNILSDLQKFIIHLLNAGIKIYINENKRGKFMIDGDKEISINLTGLIRLMTGLDKYSTTNARRLFKNLCEILPENISKKHVEDLSAADNTFKTVLDKVSKGG